jgi:hypothetical protein
MIAGRLAYLTAALLAVISLIGESVTATVARWEVILADVAVIIAAAVAAAGRDTPA